MVDEYSIILEDLETLKDNNTEKQYTSLLKKEMDESGILLKNKKENSKGKFNDKVWVTEDELCKGYRYIRFEQLDEFRFQGLKNIDITRIKAFMAYCFIENGLQSTTVFRKFGQLIKFITASDFINKERIFDLTLDIDFKLKEKKDLYEDITEISSNIFDPSVIIKYKSQESKKKRKKDFYSDSWELEYISVGREYLEFLVKKLHVVNPIYNKYINVLTQMMGKYTIKSSSRDLPDSISILKFHNYIDSFFGDNTINPKLKLLYRPIHIWWKLTNIIPMRPSEYTVKMERNCIFIKNNDYYIKINRVKDGFSSKFPIKKEFRIDDELANLILGYINDTEQYGKTKTLFSFRACCELRDILGKTGFSVVNTGQSQKINEDYFTLNNFAKLLNSFYKVVIQGIYKDNTLNCYISPGDTRHFAFFSLLMQGLPPIEIALLGGHSTLEMQLNYQNCIEYYIGTELYEFLFTKKTNNLSDKLEENINNIINNLPAECPKPPSERLELKIGYCLCDFSQDACDDVGDFHCFCSKWWAEPTRETFDKLKKLVEEEIKKRSDSALSKLSTIEELLAKNYWSRAKKNTKIDPYVETKTNLNQLKNDCDNIVGLKISLMAQEFIDGLKNKRERQI